ncbi:uncharacterized protein LOC117580129 [Drosophila guanche]|uniref:DDE Tnp4 domain-containing protein n=1 Tax=Drosophila guanche TaxID=7266 RepID=A0A3B0J4Z0_DROGU|nr:uncharacterized protein LOC117580129 [Drosophila guanche]SPP76747.1 Hypothetical predicted protein [Drosophila guanche]
MEKELELINSNLNNALAKLVESKRNQTKDEDSQKRKERIARLLWLHIQHVQLTVITHRRRSQQRSRRRYRLLRSFFMQQMVEMQSNYMQMYAMLSLKRASLEDGESAESDANEESADDQQTVSEDIFPELSDEEFLNKLHITRSTFEALCRQLTPAMRQGGQCSGRSLEISLDKCVALAVYYLASGERISIISNLFSVPRLKTIKCLKLFCNAVMTTLGKALRKLPQSEPDCGNVMAGFQKESNMPAALVGILGVCSIPIRANGGPVNKAGQSVMRMEFLLDDRMLFRELQLGHGSKASMMPMFSTAPNRLTDLPQIPINGRLISPFVLVPPQQNYPLRRWLLQRYADPISPHEHDFNEVAERLKELSDCALHRLMSRWHFFIQPLDIRFQTASCIITAAAVLHNLLEQVGEPHMLEWGNAVDVSKFKTDPLPDCCDDAEEETERGLRVRDFLARTISSTEI